MRIKWIVRFCILTVVYYSGVLGLIRLLRRQFGRPRDVILAYHGVRDWGRFLEMFCEPRLFERQMAFLATHYEMVSIAEVAASAPRRGGRDRVAVTFDDGYEDNFSQAWPIAARHGVRLTIYVASGLVDAQRTTVIDALIRIFTNARRPVLSVPELSIDALPLQTDAELEHALGRVERAIRPRPFADQQQLLARVASELDVPPERWQTGMLSWEQVRALSDAGNEIGAHSHSHAVLADLSAQQLEGELSLSRDLLARCLGRAPRHFAYPFGGREHFNDAVVEAVGRHGYESAVALYEGTVDRERLLRLPRFMVTTDRSASPWGRFSKAVFACEVEGVARAIFSLGRSA